MYGGIFRQPPQPQQQRRFVPIPEQGDQPPRRNPALAMACILACWPTGLEQEPQQRRPSAATMEQPVAAQPAYTRQQQSIHISRETSYEVRQPVRIAPLTLTYGDQPPRRSNVVPDAIVRSWEPPHHYDWRSPTFIFGVQVNDPPPQSLAGLNAILRINWLPPPPQAQRDRKNIAPLTLTYGDAPPVWSPGQQRALIVELWQPAHPRHFRQLSAPQPVAATIVGTWSNVIEANAGGRIEANAGGRIEVRA